MLKKFLFQALAASVVVLAPALAEAAEGFSTANVNMRAGPSTAYPAVVVIPAGEPLEIHGCLAEVPWCDVEFDGGRGWVAGRYVQAMYRQQRVYVGPQYYRPLGIPTVTFSVGSYWDRNYRNRDFYRERDRWRRSPPRPDWDAAPPRWNRTPEWDRRSERRPEWDRQPDRRDWDRRVQQPDDGNWQQNRQGLDGDRNRNWDRNSNWDGRPGGERRFDGDRRMDGDRRFDGNRGTSGDPRVGGDRRVAPDRRQDQNPSVDKRVGPQRSPLLRGPGPERGNPRPNPAACAPNNPQNC